MKLYLEGGQEKWLISINLLEKHTQLNITQHQMRIGNHDISYQLRAGGDNCILFIHGLGCSKDSFSHAFMKGYFSDKYTLLASDLLGHGDSSRPEDLSYTLEEQCNFIYKLIQKLDPKCLNIIAHSMGSVVAMLLMEKLNNVRSFFCLEGNLIPEDCHISLKVSSIEEMKFVNKIYPIAPLTFACKGSSTEKLANPIAFYRSAKSLVNWSFHGDLLKKYKNISIRKVYIYGEKNKQITILNKLKNLDVVQINGAGHFMMIDNPKDTYRTITTIL